MGKQNILVTGGFGYVGSRLTPHLLDLGFRVTVIDLCLYGKSGLNALSPKQKKNLNFIEADIRDPQAVKEVMDGIDTVIHLAAISNDPTGEVDEVLTRQVNFDAVGLLLSVACASQVKRFINASSSSVFGIKHVPDVTESLEPEPLTFYSKYKMLSEWLIIAASNPHFCTVNIRPATICGFSMRQRFDLTVNKLTADAFRKKIITVHGGEQRRPNVGMADMVNLYSQLIEMDSELINGRTFNFGFENLKVMEIAKLIQGELKDLGVKIQVTSTVDNRDYHISSNKLLDTLYYQPISSIQAEVANLRKILAEGQYPDIDAPQFYNMKVMKLTRSAKSYEFLSR